MNRTVVVSVLALLAACFSESGEVGTTDGGSTGGESTTTASTSGQTSLTTDTGTTTTGTSVTSDATTSSTTSDDTTGTTSDTTSTSSTTDDGTDTAGACDDGFACLPIPNGWSGPVVAESGSPGQCADASLAIAYAGTVAAWDESCECDCGGATVQECGMDFLVGGDPDTCADNTEVGDHCTYAWPNGPITCENGNGCFFTGGEMVSADSYRVCSPGTGNALAPEWDLGYRLCDPNDAVGAACDEGQCGDARTSLCIYLEEAGAQCPAAFPEHIDGHQNFSANQVACECACQDPSSCAYLTWHELGACTGSGGDDDPSCSEPTGNVEFLPYAIASLGCQPEEDPAEPDFPLSDPITVCCTSAP